MRSATVLDGGGEPGRSDRYKWIALTNTTIGILMATIDTSIVLISLPAIFRGIGLNPLVTSNTSYLLWMLMGYMVVTAVLVVTFGRIGDMVGRVKMYNLGFAIFTVGSLAASLTYFGGSTAALYLIMMRVVQGIGGAMIMANSAAIITDAFPEDQRGMALGINTVAGIAGSFIGLVAGGLLSAIDWHLIFYVSVPIGLFGTVWAYMKLREVSVREGGRLDVPGNILFGVGLISVLVGITYALQPYGGSAMGWLSPLVLALLSGGVAMLIGFVIVENKVPDPMFDIRLFRIRAFAAGNIASLLSSIGRGGLMFMLIIWLQGIWLPLHGYNFVDTPLWAGIYMLPLTFGFLVAGPLSGYLSDRFGARPFATGGMIGAAITFALLMLLPVDFDYPWFALILLGNGLSMGLFAAPNTAGVMNAVPSNRRGVASGMRSTFQNAGMTLSIGLFFTIMVVGLSARLPVALTRGLTAHGVPVAAASKVAHLPPVSVLFAAFLGYNPIQTLLGPALGHVSPTDRAALTGHGFFAGLISAPFHHGLTIVFSFAALMCAVAAAASWMRGKKPVLGTPPTDVEVMGTPPPTDVRVAAPADPVPAAVPVGTGTRNGHGAGADRPAPVPARRARLSEPVRVVTISASYGAGGTEVGPAVARRLGLPFLDRAIPQRVADLLGVSPDDAQARDEAVRGAMVRSLVNLVGAPVSFGVSGVQTVPTDDEEEYRRATEKVLWDLAGGGGAVVLGRAGAVVLASCPYALHVRLDGPPETRVRRAMALGGGEEEAVWAQLRRTDHARAAYVHHFYGVDPADPALYDLVVDTSVVPLESCVDAIVAAAGTGSAAAAGDRPAAVPWGDDATRPPATLPP